MNSIENERKQGRLIAANAETIWNWTSAAGKQRAQRRAELLVRYGRFQPGEYILEIGCGTGLFTEKVKQLTACELIAVDISEDLLAVAKAKLPHLEFKVEDAMNLSFVNEHFSAVYGSSVLHHLNIEKSLQELFRVLGKGGRIVFAEPNMLNPQIFLQKNIPFLKMQMNEVPDETAFVRWTLKKIMVRVGFVNISILPYDFLHPATPSFLITPVKWLGRVIEKTPILKEIAGSLIIYGEKPR